MPLQTQPSITKRLPLQQNKTYLWLKRDSILYLLLLPGILYYILFHYAPMYGLLIAFQKFNIFEGMWKSPWVGLDNFKQLFDTPDFYKIVFNTLSLNVYSLVFGFPVPILIALLLNEVKKKGFTSVVQSLLYLPHFFSWVIIGGIIINILSPEYGVVNSVIQSLGLDPIFFLGEKLWWVITYVAAGIWKEAGWSAIIYVAALTGIDTELYEAAKMDGANRWKQLNHITLPGIKATIAVMLILKVGQILTIGFEQPFILANPLVIDRADVISTYIYRAGILQSQFSLTAAMGMIQAVIGFFMIITANKIIKKMGEDGIF